MWALPLFHIFLATDRHTFEFFTNKQTWQCWHYCQRCTQYICFLLYLHQLMSVNIKIEMKGNIKIKFQGYALHWKWLIFTGRTKTKLAMLVFLYCREFVKNSIGLQKSPIFRYHAHQCVLVRAQITI